MLTLFEPAVDDGRPHPRLQVRTPPAADPRPREKLIEAPAALADAQAFCELLDQAIETQREHLAGADLADAEAPRGSRCFYRNSIRAQRCDRLLAQARAIAQAAAAGWTEQDNQRALYELAARRDSLALRDTHFDDSNTGTYHSFGHDKPFVHYLEELLDALPEEGTPAFGLVDAEQQHAIRRQRAQAQAHLDYLMRHKYAYDTLVETDIERTLGGFLCDKKHRAIATETPQTKGELCPKHELLRIEPTADHPDAGAWVYRDGDTLRRSADHELVEGAGDLLRSVPVEAGDLTFRRAPHSPLLRAGVRFDWDRNGFVTDEPISWISWAGHCDIKAIMEQLGITLVEQEPRLREHRTDTGQTFELDRSLLTEMLASVLELGSQYLRADGSGFVNRGQHLFGGARNSSLPDRLQLTGLGAGQHYRWPLKGRKSVFRVETIELGGEALTGDVPFWRYQPDADNLDFTPNQRYLGTVEGDYNIISVTGAKLTAKLWRDGFDSGTGYPTTEETESVIDLTGTAGSERCFLGTYVNDTGQREIYEVWLLPQAPAVVAELKRWTRQGDRYVPAVVAGAEIRVPLAKPLSATLSREMKRDDPATFQALLEIGLKTGQSICVDTDAEAPVWNGVVTRLDARKLGENRERRTEHHLIDITARFGNATLEYLVRRDLRGEPEAYCPLETPGASPPDFLWHDQPDIGSKGIQDGEWLFNWKMLERNLIAVRDAPWEEGGFFVEDDHIKHLYELLFAALGGYPFTIVHNNKRYGFKDEASWQRAVDRLSAARQACCSA